jgi:serine/threonine-protein kinase
MGEVWLAWSTALDRRVAVKLLAGRSSRLLVREAAALSQLRHPHIVTMHEFGTTKDGTAFIVMDRVHGETLAHHVRHVSRLTLREARVLVSQLADALGHAHARGIVHRDVKPSNVLLASESDGIDARLIDFGISFALSRSDIARGRRAGTPGYMSPEQRADASGVDGRADMWSLAATVFYGLTGEHYAPSTHVTSTTMPSSVTTWFERALADEPRRRFNTPREMARAFEQACDAVHEVRMEALCDEALTQVESMAAPARPTSTVDVLAAHWRTWLLVAGVLLTWLFW